MRDEPKKSPLLRWGLPALRYGLCAVAILYLYYNVTWYDSVTLAGSKARVSWAPANEAGDGGLSRVEFFSGDPSILNASVSKVEGSTAEVRVNSLVNRTVFPEASDYVLLREELSISGRDPIYESSLALASKLVEEA